MESKKNCKKAQNLLEYILIAALAAIICGTIFMKIDLKSLKNYMFMRPATEDGKTIEIEAMTTK